MIINGKKIRALRTERGLNRPQLGEIAGIGPTMVGYIEEGKKTTNVDVLKRIADYFGCTVDDLLKDEPVCASETA